MNGYFNLGYSDDRYLMDFSSRENGLPYSEPKRYICGLGLSVEAGTLHKERFIADHLT